MRTVPDSRHRLLLEKPDEILVGVDLIMKAVGVDKGYIGIENNKPDAIALLTEKAKAYPHIEVVPLQVNTLREERRVDCRCYRT